MIQKFISGDMIYEVGDFYGGDCEECVITQMEMEDGELIVTTLSNSFSLPLKGGEYLKMSDGTTQFVQKRGTEYLN